MPKGTKAVKVSDIRGNKPWLIKRGRTSYSIETRELFKRILIVCEGQTEQLYFSSFQVLSLEIEVVNLKGESKLRLVNEAVRLNQESNFDKTWCVFDMDVNSGEKEFADFDNSIASAAHYGYEVAYSNDAFEIWFCLHYEYFETSNRRHYYYQFLSEKWDINYIKEGKRFEFCRSIHKRLEDDPYASKTNAHSFAEKLVTLHGDLPYHKRNPVTTVNKLVQYLEENSRK